jgi:hypothetical protein
LAQLKPEGYPIRPHKPGLPAVKNKEIQKTERKKESKGKFQWKKNSNIVPAWSLHEINFMLPTPSIHNGGRLSTWTGQSVNPQPSLQERRQKQSHRVQRR